MNDDNLKKFSDRKIGGKQVIASVVALFALVLIVGGVSYAYFGASVTNAEVRANLTTPGFSGKKCSIVATNCGFTVDMNTMYKSNNSTTTPVKTDTCSVKINCSGTAGDYCNYNVQLVNGSKQYARSVTLSTGVFEYSGTLSGDATKDETQMDTLAGTKIATGQSVLISTTGTPVEKTYTLTTKFYNLPQDQSSLLDSSYSKTYQHSLKIVDLSCNWNH